MRPAVASGRLWVGGGRTVRTLRLWPASLTVLLVAGCASVPPEPPSSAHSTPAETRPPARGEDALGGFERRYRSLAEAAMQERRWLFTATYIQAFEWRSTLRNVGARR